MSSPAPAKSTPPKKPAKPTAYAIEQRQGDHSWMPAGSITSTGGARTAIRKWADSQGDKFTGGTLRAIPLSNITEVVAKVETRRQLTLGETPTASPGAP